VASVPSLHPDASVSLMRAVIASSNAPLVLLDGDFTVIGASASFCLAFDIDPATAPGRTVFDLGEGEWDVPQLRSLLGATLAGHTGIVAYEMDIERSGGPLRHLVLNAQNLDFDGGGSVRLLLTLTDVTAARAAEKAREDLLREKDSLLREKAILLEELHHRIANSLQIIASILMQSAKTMNSEESRRHLHDAHSRVMSVAALQRQLSMSRVGDVALRSYFTDLCGSISASMIADQGQLSLHVDVDDTITGADVSVSLGLIVTELVINALKHAFPGRRHGAILVGYKASGPDWTLSVTDDGVGFAIDGDGAQPGLGTSIVEALARQLHATVEIKPSQPGTSVSVAHTA